MSLVVMPRSARGADHFWHVLAVGQSLRASRTAGRTSHPSDLRQITVRWARENDDEQTPGVCHVGQMDALSGRPTQRNKAPVASQEVGRDVSVFQSQLL